MARFACFCFLGVFAALAPAIKLVGNYLDPVIKNVEYARGLINCPGGMQNDTAGTCEERALLLDVYPPSTTDVEQGPLFPAILLAHGSANTGGDKDTGVEVDRANTYRRKGFVVFVPNYRLEYDNGTYPGTDFTVGLSPWRSLYPAVRDVKAAVRFIRANAEEYGVDAQRIVASGTSAGGMNVLAAFTGSRNAFTKELSLDDDPTLDTTNLDHAPVVKALVVHSGPPWGIQQYEQFVYEQPESARYASGWNVSREPKSFVTMPPPLIQFHGDDDTLINVSNASVTQDMYATTGVHSKLHVLEGVGHCDWTYWCDSQDISNYYCDAIDGKAIKFIYKAFERAL